MDQSKSFPPGPLDAIAFQLTKALRQDNPGVAVQVRVSQGKAAITLIIEGEEQIPEQARAVAVIEARWAEISSQWGFAAWPLRVYGRQRGNSRSAWSQGVGAARRNLAAGTRPRWRLPDGEAGRVLGIGLGLGWLLVHLPLLNLLFKGFIVLVHELGHALTHWLFGRPAIPSVNLLHGGGVTLTFGQSGLVVMLVYGLMVAGIWWGQFCWPERRRPLWLGVGIGGILAYTACLRSPLNELLSTVMGHGFEVLAVFVCLLLAMSGWLCRWALDRTIYAVLGFYTLFSQSDFAWKIIHDLDYRDWYEGGIGGAIDNDFVIVVADYTTRSLSQVLELFLGALWLAPLMALLTFGLQDWLRLDLNGRSSS